jgi:hypothetical protein
MPGQLEVVPVRSVKFRLNCVNSESSTDFKVGMLCSWCAFQSDTSGSSDALVGIANAFRVRRIQVYTGSKTSANEFNPVGLQLAGGAYARNEVYSATGTVANPGYLDVRTKPNNFSGFWHSASGTLTGIIFTIVGAVAGTVVDITMDYTMAGADIAGTQDLVLVTAYSAVAAGVYYMTPTGGNWDATGLQQYIYSSASTS